MAEVITLEALASKLVNITTQFAGGIRDLQSLATRERVLISEGTSAEDIHDELTSMLADLVIVLNKTVAVLAGINWVNAYEVRLGSPVNYKIAGIIATNIITQDEAGAPLDTMDDGTGNAFFQVGDIIELINPQEPENAQEVEASSGTPPTKSVLTFDPAIPGAVITLEDRQVILRLKER